MKRGVDTVVGHLRAHAGVLKSDDWNGLRHVSAAEQLLDAGAGTEERLQARVLVEEFLARRSPRDRVIRTPCATLAPNIDFCFRQLACKRIAPALAGSRVVMSDGDAHASGAY